MGIKSALKSCVAVMLKLLYKSKYKIVFESNSDFCDNSRAVFEYMQANSSGEFAKYKYVWCVKNPENFKNKQDKNIIFTSFREHKYAISYLYHIGTAKTVIYSHAMPPFIDTKRQTVACLWHGTPLKKIGFGTTEKKPFSFILSSGKWCTEALIKCFGLDKSDIAELGYPRCDELFFKNNALDTLGIDKSKYKKTILWMPTFRRSSEVNITDLHDTQTGLPLIESSGELELLNDKLKEKNILLLIKLHPLQDLSGIDLVSLSNIFMLTNKQLDEKDVRLYHLVNNANALLTDYSSIYFDYLLLNRPIGFIIDDIDEYTKNRGFVVENPLLVMPGEKIKTKEQLYDFLSDTANGKDEFEADRLKVNDMVNKYKDANSAKRLLKKIL